MSTSHLYRVDKTKGCTILLVRHPESESNNELHRDPHVSEDVLLAHKNPDITELGQIQIEKTVDHLVNKCNTDPEARIIAITSIQSRAKKMAMAYLEKSANSNTKEYTVLTDDADLYEYRRPGKGDITIDNHILKEEPWYGFLLRVKLFKDRLQAIISQNNCKYIIVFGHSIFFSALAHLCTSPKYRLMSVDDLSFHFPNASISAFIYNGKMWSMLYHGSVSHLEEHERTGTHTHIY